MKISYNWLKQFLKIDWDVAKTAELLTDIGLEVEGIEGFESIKGGLKGVLVGEVLTCIKHPDADRLKLTTVNIGDKEPLQIVCGAPNVDVGQKVPIATIGTTLYTKEGESWKIKKGKIRGQESHGMICAEDELGLGDSHDGIMILNKSVKVGTLVSDLFEIENDNVIEIGLTPNRADAMSHFGVARDLKAGLLQKEISLELITPSVSAYHLERRTLKIDVDVKDKMKAPRYCGVTLTGIKVEQSPLWLQNRLRSIGLSPINNVVDITNYVLHELGQPLHAFDANKIKGNKIEVKTLKSGTKFKTLDGIDRELHEEDLMICDAEEPMCIAGVFGGEESGVTENTTSIFLESAYFDPVSIRKTAKRHGLNTDASFRFERGIDPNITEYALKRAALLICDITGAEIAGDLIDLYPKKIEDFQVRLSFENTEKLIGEEIPRETIKSILTSLEIKVNNVTETGLGLTVPAYRNDVLREADVIEEVLRIYGYNNIKTNKKLNASISYSDKIEDYKIQNTIGDQLVSQGFYEILTNSLTNPRYIINSDHFHDKENVTILNALSQELSVMRQSLLFSGLEVVSHNINRKRSDIKFFEFGKTYHQTEKGHEEHKMLGIFVSGNKNRERWNATQTKSDFFYLKGIVEAIFQKLGISCDSSMPKTSTYLSEGLTLNYKNATLVEFGLVKKSVTKAFDISQDLLFANFRWDTIISMLYNNAIVYKNIPKYPEVRRDFALLVDDHVSFQSVYELAFQSEKKLLKNIDLFDVYEGSKLPKGKKSYAVSFILQDEHKTLTDIQIDKVMSKLQTSFEQELGAQLR